MWNRSSTVTEGQVWFYKSKSKILVHAHASKFSFSKIPGAPNINIFCENWHEAFYIKEQTQENKFEIWVLKTTFFFVFWIWFSFKNNRHTNFLLIGRYFWKHTKKSYWPPKTPFGHFWRLITIFCAISKILTK